MLRLAPTTLSLSITEVKEFEHRRRFRKYLDKDDDRFRHFALRPKNQSLSQEEGHQPDEQRRRKSHKETTHGTPRMTATTKSPKLLSVPPRRPPKPEDFNHDTSPYESSSSRSGSPTSSVSSGQPAPVALPPPLPPPFSSETRLVSNTSTLPSVSGTVHNGLAREGIRQEAPATPPRRSSLRDNQADPRLSPTFGNAETTVFSPALDSTFIRIYNDSLPASSQPQTPQNLPDARHRSRVQGSYTAPASRMVTRSAHRAIIQERERDDPHSDLDTPGFRGIYGGIGNSEDSRLFHEASLSQDGGLTDASEG
ncbi:hypothetical protein F5Y15DRAFT_413586 [Xylariaceae sp. FL0016]|nr:hypothetical protein F5Y15DRAFT_413586 [Xylariaceae sp. FL0016]